VALRQFVIFAHIHLNVEINEQTQRATFVK